MFIDRSFFYGELEVVNSESDVVASRLNNYISKYEPKFLSDVLGYALYKSLRDGLLINPVQDKWVKLIYGDSDAGWNGLVYNDSFYAPIRTVLQAADNNRFYHAGGLATYDPAVGQDKIIDPWLLGKVITEVFRENFRPLELGVEYENRIGGGIVLLQGQTFNNLEVMRISVAPYLVISSIPNGVSNVYKKSPIANFVYFYWLRNKQTTTTEQGEKLPKIEGGRGTSVIYKQCSVWNDMCEQVESLFRYLQINYVLYPQYLEIMYYKLIEYQKMNPLFTN